MVPANSAWFPGAEMINSAKGSSYQWGMPQSLWRRLKWDDGRWTGRKSRITGGSTPHAPGILLEDCVCDRVIDWSWKKSQDLLVKWACLLPSIPSLPLPPSLFFSVFMKKLSPRITPSSYLGHPSAGSLGVPHHIQGSISFKRLYTYICYGWLLYIQERCLLGV